MDSTKAIDKPAAARDAVIRTAPRRRGADAYDTLLWRLQPRLEEVREQNDGAGFLVGITSCDRKAGVSTVAANLAIRAADHQMRPVLLIDASAEHPTVARQFRLRGVQGLADVMAGHCSVSDAVHETTVDGLEVMPVGTTGLMDRVGLDCQHVEALLSGLRESHQMVVFDLPLTSELRHMLLIARRLDAAILAVSHEQTSATLLERAAEQLRSDGVPLAGTVVCRHKQRVPSWIRNRF
ncbi:Tyrosine-protein kinase YwqD [Botrimarina colliarenosi]|uniref:Tyrosine-protein kinase YwqD n=1 Tax=Botrimarina colliarenosi TaxID=2528001 RepID=A0A5C6A768_9BACT|nr:CpsD/CapB family tyrosine-protein kinase [Botrimarina colliarenosi]TWT95842.1 Tyrosine-protein kinase YwqD [Botrimarina colliarenosi]